MLQTLALREFKVSTFRGYSGDGTDGWSSVTVASRCLHVGNVAGSMTEDKLRQQFSIYGKIEALKCVVATHLHRAGVEACLGIADACGCGGAPCSRV
jgi:hypothetical protein